MMNANPPIRRGSVMKKLLIILMVMLGLAFQASAAQSADATSAWNSLAANYNFSTTSGGSLGATFADSYIGSDLENDFVHIITGVAQIMGTPVPPYEPDDLMNASLQNWPDG
jgi:hypothetical protein